MKITQNIFNINSINPVKNEVKTSFRQSASSLNADTFQLSETAQNEKIVNNLLAKYKKFGIEQYKALTPQQKDLIFSTCNQNTKDVATASVNMAKFAKQELDKAYGEGNYVFCCIGTSPAGIARVFEFMGVETKYFPISELRVEREINHRRFADKEYLDEQGLDFTEYGKFLSEQGISSEEIDKSGKKYLFFDYTCSGHTLRMFEYILREAFAIDTPNVEYKSINGYLTHWASKNKDKKKLEEIDDYVFSYMYRPKMGMYGGIGHLPFRKLNEITLHKDLDSGDFAKKFNLLVMDNLQSQGLLKNNSKNRKSL